MVNSEKIKARMKELGLRQADIAAAWGVKQSSASLKINNVRPMYMHEANILADLLRIDNGERGIYFFSQE